ncbi:MAG: hypothetical protein ISQ11_07575 [Planctomycetes bacterium]|nr:hypothetical protein [Planctomycetota bacterium]
MKQTALLAALSAALVAPAAAQYSVVAPGGLIPDNTGGALGVFPTAIPTAGGFLSSTVVLPADAATIDGIHLDGLEHTWVGDLQIVLFDPNGVGHILVNRVNYMNPTAFGTGCDFSGDYAIVADGVYEWPVDGNSLCNAGSSMLPGAYPQFFFAHPMGQWAQGAGNVFDTPMCDIPVIAGGTYELQIYDWESADVGSLDAFRITGTTSAPAPTCTQSFDNQTIEPGGVACTTGPPTNFATDNQWLRRYSPAAECGVTSAIVVEGVTFAVETAASPDGLGQPITLRAYTIPVGASLSYANMSLLTELEELVPDGTDQIITTRFDSPRVLTIGFDLVIEVAKTTAATEEFVYFPGSNGLGQTGPSYIASASCGLAEPTDLATIGFPNTHLILDPVYSTTFLGDSICGRSEPNSSGLSASIHAIGSDLVVRNDLTLSCAGLPADTFVFLLASQSEAISYPGNSEGFLCLAGSIGRGVGSVIGNSGPSGTFTVAADLRSLPQPTGNVSAQCGETWYFQGWFRDGVGGLVTSNMTDAVGLTLR